MKTASTMLQIAALAACFAVHAAAHDQFKMHGVRRALRTIEGQSHQVVSVVEASSADVATVDIG